MNAEWTFTYKCFGTCIGGGGGGGVISANLFMMKLVLLMTPCGMWCSAYTITAANVTTNNETM